MAVLREIGRSDAVSQRGLARAAGVSATMINAYVDDLVGRELIEVTGETNRTYRYHLTDAGRTRQTDLAALFSREVFELYAQLKHDLLGVPDATISPAVPEVRSA